MNIGQVLGVWAAALVCVFLFLAVLILAPPMVEEFLMWLGV
jgi:hypothetical protein